MQDNYQDGDYNDFNDLDYDAAKQLLTQGSSMPTQVVNKPSYEVPDISYDDALKLLRGSKGENVARGTKLEAKNEPSISDRTMTSFLHQQSPLGPAKDYDPLASQDNALEKVGKFGVDVAAGMVPFQMGAANLLKYGGRLSPVFSRFLSKDPYFAASAMENALAGGAYDKLQGDSGIGGAIAGAISPLPSAATNAALKYGAQKFAQSAIPGMTKRATDYMRNLLDPNDYAGMLYNRFSSMFDKNKAAWGETNKAATGIDEGLTKTIPQAQPPKTSSLLDESGNPIQIPQPEKMVSKVDFNASPYHSYINDFTNKIKALEPAKKEPYSQALSLAQKAKELAPESFSGTVASRKNINQNLKDFLNQQGSNTANNSMNSQSKQFLTGLKNTLKKDIPEANQGNVGQEAMQDFTDKWNTANKAHQELKEFYRSPQPGSGVVKPVRQTREAFQAAQQGQKLDPAIIGKYMPRPNQGGTEGLDQLAKLYGSKSQAQEAAKAYINRRPLTNGVSTLDVSNEYAKLSPAQRDWIYGGSKEGDLLNTINNVRQSFGKEPARSLLTAGAHHLFGFGLPFLAGSAGAHYLGGDWKDDVFAGLGMAATGKIPAAIAGRLSPRAIRAVSDYAQRSPVNYGRYFNMPLQAAISSGRNN